MSAARSYPMAGIVLPAAGGATASPSWGESDRRMVQSGWVMSLAALTIVRELRYDPDLKKLVALPVAEVASLRGPALAQLKQKTLAQGERAVLVAPGANSSAVTADVELTIAMPPTPFRLSFGALGPPGGGISAQLACSPTAASKPGACTLFAPSGRPGQKTRQAFPLKPGENSTELRVLVDKVVVEIFAGGGRAVRTVAAKGGVDATQAAVWVQAEAGNVTVSGGAWGMGCGWLESPDQLGLE